MSPGHFRIPGHSGTDRKHRRAFKRVRKFVDQRKHSWEARRAIVPRSAANRKSVDWGGNVRRLLAPVLTTLLLMALAGVGWIGHSAFDSYVKSSPSVRGPIDINAYQFLTRSGERYLYGFANQEGDRSCRTKDLAIAREEFTLALRSCPACPEASRGLQHVALLETLE